MITAMGRLWILAALFLVPQEDPLRIFVDELVAVKPGSFKRGDQTVTIAYAFQVAKYEVPQNLWEAVMGANPSRWKGRRNSVEMLSLDEAEDFCAKLTARLREAKRIGENELIRLPSEAEWEYVARAGTTTRYSFGDDAKELGAYAWFTGNAAGNDPPVGAKKPNPWGLYDVHGYLGEWCSDAWHESWEGAPTDGSAWTTGGDATRGVIRGGSWKDGPDGLTIPARRAAPRRFQDDAVGLRCVKAARPASAGGAAAPEKR
jgi:formylglycine-generating enzyme required for sulfatase activity